MLTRTELLDQADQLRRDAAETVPGRLAELIDRRAAQLLRLPDVAELPDDLDASEQLVIDLAEQFLIDVHGITDAQFATLSEHYTNEEQIAIMFHLAFVDGFSKLSKVHPDSDVVDPTITSAVAATATAATDPVSPTAATDPATQTNITEAS